MAKTSILLVDDDQEMSEMLVEYLHRSNFSANAEYDGMAALHRLERERFDLIILDVMLPSLDGFEVLKTIRKTLATPVIMLTARGDDVDSILGLELGADDYLSKPFNPRHLVARVRAVLRRTERAPDVTGKTIAAGELALNTATMSAAIRGKNLELTGTEFRLLETLMDPVGRTHSREHLAERVLGRAYSAFDRSIDTHVSNLRRKLSATGTREIEIRSIRGAGYVLICEKGEAAR
jgi:two-component system response regulator CpxR